MASEFAMRQETQRLEVRILGMSFIAEGTEAIRAARIPLYLIVGTFGGFLLGVSISGLSTMPSLTQYGRDVVAPIFQWVK
jgi:hypothetical protein